MSHLLYSERHLDLEQMQLIQPPWLLEREGKKSLFMQFYNNKVF